MAANVNITADKRTPFIDSIDKVGPTLVGSAFLMHVRNENGDTGSPLIPLSTAAPGSQGISCTYIDPYVYVNGNGQTITTTASRVLINISEATLEALSLANPTNEPLPLKYDLHVTPSGGVKSVAFYGDFVIKPGSTI
jgi:hypothetical protein